MAEQSRPQWCPNRACEYRGHLEEGMCVGFCPEEGDILYRLCIVVSHKEVYVVKLTKDDPDAIRWLLDQLEGRRKFWRRRKK